MHIKLFLQTNRLKRTVQNYLKQSYLYVKYYSFFGQKGKCIIIYKADGRLHHGGLADRFIGIMIVFAMSKISHIPFKIDYTSPFNLSDYILPNLYDWIICPNDISYNRLHTNVAVHYDDSWWPMHFSVKKQTHIYTNYPSIERINQLFNTSFTYKDLFNELFRLTPHLSEKIEAAKREIGKPYISVQLRFVRLLGDFKDVRYPTLNMEKQNKLIQYCIKCIKEIYSKHANQAIFISTDSQRFLQEAKAAIDGIYSMQGQIVHIDYSDIQKQNDYEKTFMDFFILGGSSIIYNIIGEGLIPSGFSMLSAKIHDVPYERININKLIKTKYENVNNI